MHLLIFMWMGKLFFNKNIPDLTDTSDLDVPSISIHSLDAVDNFVMGTMTIDSRWLNNDPGIILKGENCTLEYRNYYTQVVDDHYLYYYEWYAHLLDTGSQTIKIKLNKFGNELINQSWTINNPEKQLYDMTEDEFIMSTWGKYFYLRLYSNDADMASKISKFALVNLEDDTVIEYPQYYKRYIEELDGYSQDRYLYIYQFPKKSMSLTGYFKGKVTFVDGTSITTKNTIDSSYLIWGDSSTSYDTITGMDNVNNNPDTGTNNNNNNGSNDNGSDGNSNNGNSDNGGSTDAVKEGVDKIKRCCKRRTG